MKARLAVLAVFGTVSAALSLPVSAYAAAPTIDTQWVTDVSAEDATLHAQINPNGLPTHYELQLDTTGNFKFEQNTSCPLAEAPMWCLQVVLAGDPLPSGLVQPPEFVLPASVDSQHVSVNMARIGATLKPSTTYHYRAIAANGEELVEGPTQTFTTPPDSPAPPSIYRQWATAVTPEDATLHAEINPNGLFTKYMLQLDTTGNFKFHQNDTCVLHPPGIICAMVVIDGDPLPPGLVQPEERSLLASAGSQHVGVNMASIGATLQPETTYYYRAIAANENGFAFGPTQTFMTPAVVESPESEPEAEPPSLQEPLPEEESENEPMMVDQKEDANPSGEPNATTGGTLLESDGSRLGRRMKKDCRRKSRHPSSKRNREHRERRRQRRCVQASAARP